MIMGTPASRHQAREANNGSAGAPAQRYWLRHQEATQRSQEFFHRSFISCFMLGLGPAFMSLTLKPRDKKTRWTGEAETHAAMDAIKDSHGVHFSCSMAGMNRQSG